MAKVIKSKQQMRLSFLQLAREAAKTNKDIAKAFAQIEHLDNSFGWANGTVRDLLILHNRWKKPKPIMSLDYEILWFSFHRLLDGADSLEVKNAFVPALAQALTYRTKKMANAGKPFGNLEMIRLIDAIGRHRGVGSFRGEALHAVNKLMCETSKRFAKQKMHPPKKIDANAL